MNTDSRADMEWFKVSALACSRLRIYVERRWYGVAVELFTRLCLVAKFDDKRVQVTDAEQTDNTDASESTKFCIRYYTETKEEASVAYRLFRRETLALAEQGWLEAQDMKFEIPIVFTIRALKYTGEKASTQKRHTKKAKATQEKRTQTAGTATMDEVTRELTRLFDKIKSGKGDVKDVRDLSKQYDVFLDILKRDILKKEKTSSSEAKKHSYSSSKWIGEDMETKIRQSSKISKGKQKQLIELARMMSSLHRKDLMELIEKTGV